MKTNFKIIYFIIVALMIVAASCKKTDNNNTIGEIGPKVGQTAPDFTLPDKDGNEKSLSDYEGELVLIDFWASWCHFCRDENPGLVSLYSEYKDKGFDIVGVSIDTDKSSWLSAVESDGILYDQLIDISGFDSPVVDAYGVDGIPKMILTDQDGIILLITSKASDVASMVEQRLD